MLIGCGQQVDLEWREMERELNSIVSSLGVSQSQREAPKIKRENVLISARFENEAATIAQKNIDRALTSHGYTRKTRVTFESQGENWVYCHERKPHRSAIWVHSKNAKTAYLNLQATGFSNQYANCGSAKLLTSQAIQ